VITTTQNNHIATRQDQSFYISGSDKTFVEKEKESKRFFIVTLKYRGLKKNSYTLV
jgi:hypothetical protein